MEASGVVDPEMVDAGRLRCSVWSLQYLDDGHRYLCLLQKEHLRYYQVFQILRYLLYRHESSHHYKMAHCTVSVTLELPRESQMSSANAEVMVQENCPMAMPRLGGPPVSMKSNPC